ncbi:7TM-DISM domain-containing protein [Azotobacter sp. CWF10]
MPVRSQLRPTTDRASRERSGERVTDGFVGTRGQASKGTDGFFPRWRICVRLALLLSLLHGAPPAIAAQPEEPAALPLDGSEQPVDLRPHLQLLRDPGGRLQVEDVMADGRAFVPVAGRRDLNLGYTRDTVWLRLDLESRAKDVRDWQIEFLYPSLDRIELFGAGEEPLLGGDQVPAEQRDSPTCRRPSACAWPLASNAACTSAPSRAAP